MSNKSSQAGRQVRERERAGAEQAHTFSNIFGVSYTPPQPKTPLQTHTPALVVPAYASLCTHTHTHSQAQLHAPSVCAPLCVCDCVLCSRRTAKANEGCRKDSTTTTTTATTATTCCARSQLRQYRYICISRIHIEQAGSRQEGGGRRQAVAFVCAIACCALHAACGMWWWWQVAQVFPLTQITQSRAASRVHPSDTDTDTQGAASMKHAQKQAY